MIYLVKHLSLLETSRYLVTNWTGIRFGVAMAAHLYAVVE